MRGLQIGNIAHKLVVVHLGLIVRTIGRAIGRTTIVDIIREYARYP